MSRSRRFDRLARFARRKPARSHQAPHRRPLRFEPLEHRHMLAALVGVDFDDNGPVPTNWRLGDWDNASGSTLALNNLVDETNVQSGFDLSVVTSIAADTGTLTFAGSEAINTATLPSDRPAFSSLAGVLFVEGNNASLTATWTDLKPGFTYDLYVFGLEGDSHASSQSVSINGTFAFHQNPTTSGLLSNLWINGQVGSSSQPLQNFAFQATANATGQIQIVVAETADSVALGGMAIREIGYVVNSTANTDDLTPGNGTTTLREAIRMANTSAGADMITFAAGMSGATINLGGTELAITQALTIDAAPLAQNVTINAQQQSRIFNIDDTSTVLDNIPVTLAGLTLTGGRTTGSPGGGAILTATPAMLTLIESTVSGNSTVGDFAIGGGIHSFGSVTLMQSTVSGNSTAGSGARGGGIYSFGSVTLMQSTVSGNSTAGSGADGGGICASGNGNVTLTESTVSGNSTAGSGAGIFALSGVALTQSTVSGNHATGPGSSSGGVFLYDRVDNFPLSISGSIIADNTATNAPDLRPDPGSVLTVNYSLIGNTTGSGITGSTGTGNILNQNPLLGPLADNGGPTKTHALLPGSPALDAGNPNFDPGNFAVSLGGPLVFDQRGDAFARVVNGGGDSHPVVDIGAFESQGAPTAVPTGDFNSNGIVDAPDYVFWRKLFNTSGTYNLWRSHFGNTTVPTAVPAAIPLILPLSGAFADDGVANSTEALNQNGPLGVDGVTSLLVTSARAALSGRPDQFGLPNDGFFATTVRNPDIQLAYRDTNISNNTLRLDSLNEAVTIDVANGAYTQLDLAALSGDGTSPFAVDLVYADVTVTRTTTAPDWYDDNANYSTSGVVSGNATVYYLRDSMDRVTSGAYEAAADPALFGFRFAVDSARTLQSIVIRQLDTDGSKLIVLGGTLKPVGAPGAAAGASDSAIATEASGPLAAAALVSDSTEPSGKATDVFFATDFGTPRPSSTSRRNALAASPLAAASATDNQLLLALDQAITDLDHDSQANDWSTSATDARDEQDPAATPPASLAAAWLDW